MQDHVLQLQIKKNKQICLCVTEAHSKVNSTNGWFQIYKSTMISIVLLLLFASSRKKTHLGHLVKILIANPEMRETVLSVSPSQFSVARRQLPGQRNLWN